MEKKIIQIPPKQRNELLQRSGKKIRVAAYCRVSTEADEQLNSFENQVTYYTDYIEKNPLYEMAGIYADEGISGTSTKKRDDFNRMIADCEAGKIDLVITKSISRFARNTQDCLNYSRKLKNLGIGIKFEKENINTLDGTGELLFTILSSLAQDESRSISENSAWGIRSLYKQGIYHIDTGNFYGYDKDKDGHLIINEQQGKVVKWIYESFLEGMDPATLAKTLTENGEPTCKGKTKWCASTIKNLMRNEKHMGDAILQKSFTGDFLTKQKVKNEGQLAQYHIKEDHEAIVSEEVWKAAQLELDYREQYKKEHYLKNMGQNADKQPFTCRVVCAECGHVFQRRTLTRTWGKKIVWFCGQRYLNRNEPGCTKTAVYESTLQKSFIQAWNEVLNRRKEFVPKWKATIANGNELEKLRATQFMNLTKMQPLKKLDIELVSKVLDHCKIDSSTMKFVFKDGTEISLEWKNEKNKQ